MLVSLLKEWCDALLQLQLIERKEPAFYGGILCPSCCGIHGRCSDAIYPMMFMAELTGDIRYLDCAKLLFNWLNRNMSRPDGSFINDPNSQWKGITVFTVIQLGETLIHHGHILDNSTQLLWTERLGQAADFVYKELDQFGNDHCNVNYLLSGGAALAIAARVTGKPHYREKAQKLAKKSLQYFTPEGLLFGEGKPTYTVTPKGCRPIDIGYNVEESLGNLALYALLEKDTELLEKIKESMLCHLDFMLPDGGWDNSWGTRNMKWTYWGSRTSDGCQIAYGLLSKENPIFEKAAYLNTCLLKECTHGGLLYGGPMYYSAGEAPCVHHTFCHAKALACVLNHKVELENNDSKLPCETINGIRSYPTAQVAIGVKGDWRGTFSNYDFVYSPGGQASGGALTFLWNKIAGPVFTATTTEYILLEPNNMQVPQYLDNICQTPRLEYSKNGKRFSNINDLSAKMQTDEKDEQVIITSAGILRTIQQEGDIPFLLTYQLEGAVFIIQGCTKEPVRFIFPFISREERQVVVDGATAEISYYGYSVKIAASHDIKISNHSGSRGNEKIEKLFHPVGGFETIPFFLEIPQGEPFKISLSFKCEE